MEQWIIGNWKMNASRAAAAGFGAELRAGLAASLAAPGLARSPGPSGSPGSSRSAVRVGVCPPFPYLEAVGKELQGTAALLGAQNVHPQPAGAFTGEVSCAMLVDLGVTLCIVGHSERRAQFAEQHAQIRDKLRTLLAAGLQPILCVGETLAEREAGRELETVRAQLAGALQDVAPEGRPWLIAYEPVWAIGTGRTATPEQAQAMHAAIRDWLQRERGAAQVPILYGGSVTPQNAAELLRQPDISGALVGGASLKADSFLAIIRAAAHH